ncbi:MAG: alanine racemase [Cellulomonadaceae bacterium]
MSTATDATLARLTRATAGLDAPLAVVDLEALEANATELVARAQGRPIRLATKSVRVRSIVEDVLVRPGWAGVMAYSVREALWLVDHGHRDVLVGYPSVDRHALAALVASPAARRAVTLMVDDPAQARILVEVAAGSPTDPPVQVCLDVDASWRPALGPVRTHLGVRRSPLHTPQEAALAARAVEAAGLRVRGLMFYEAQVAGLDDTSPLVRLVKRRSIADLARRRGQVLEAVGDALGRVPGLVNSGGTGSIESSVSDPVVTEVTAGSGLLLPALFDRYRTVTPRPAAYVGLDVVRRPAPRFATVFGGGYVASGAAGASRLPRVVSDTARLTGAEGAGEVQTPLRMGRGTRLEVGDRVWLRHAKAGELMERFTEVHLVRGERVVATVPTYRGEGRAFG